MRYLLAILIPVAFVLGGSCDTEQAEPQPVSTPTYTQSPTWAEDSLPQRMYDFVADHPGADLMPWNDINTMHREPHENCWLASASNDGLIMCPDGFVEVLTRKVPIPEKDALIP